MQTTKIQNKLFTANIEIDDEYLSYWLENITLRLRREILWDLKQGQQIFSDGFYKDDTIHPSLNKIDKSLNHTRFWDEKIRFFFSDPTGSYLSSKINSEHPEKKIDKRGTFSWLVKELELDNASIFVLALGLLNYIDSAAGIVISSCMKDDTKSNPTFGLAQKLWDKPEEIAKITKFSHKLFQYGILQIPKYGNNYNEIDFSTEIKISSIIATQLFFPKDSISELYSIDTAHKEDYIKPLKIIIQRIKANKEKRLQILPILGKEDSNYTDTLTEISSELIKKIVTIKVDMRIIRTDNYLNSIVTLCWLKNYDLFLDNFATKELLNGYDEIDSNYLPLTSIPITIFLGINDKKEISTIPKNILLPIVNVYELSYYDRVKLWKQKLGNLSYELDDEIKECSRSFRFEKNTIENICNTFLESKKITKGELMKSCRLESELDLGELAQRIKPRFIKEKLILPPKQEAIYKEIVNGIKSVTNIHYEYGTATAWNESGIAVLFSGASGTGKTMAAEMLATSCGENGEEIPIYRVDLSMLLSKYVSEGSKNIKRLFDAAERANIIIFFDECDALFGRRSTISDSNSKYSNVETNYLLERMERFKGIAVLATNKENDIDEGFFRRLRYKIEFPPPGEKERKIIWKQCIPESVKGSEIDFDFLAKQFSVTGGNIRSIVFNALLQCEKHFKKLKSKKQKSKYMMEEILIATLREYEKVNHRITYDQFMQYGEMVKERGKAFS